MNEAQPNSNPISVQNRLSSNELRKEHSQSYDIIDVKKYEKNITIYSRYSDGMRVFDHDSPSLSKSTKVPAHANQTGAIVGASLGGLGALSGAVGGCTLFKSCFGKVSTESTDGVVNRPSSGAVPKSKLGQTNTGRRVCTLGQGNTETGAQTQRHEKSRKITHAQAHEVEQEYQGTTFNIYQAINRIAVSARKGTGKIIDKEFFQVKNILGISDLNIHCSGYYTRRT